MPSLISQIKKVFRQEISDLKKELKENERILKALGNLGSNNRSNNNLTFRVSVSVKRYLGDDDSYSYEGKGALRDVLEKAVEHFKKKSGLGDEGYVKSSYGYNVWLILPKLGGYLLPKKNYANYNENIKAAKTTSLSFLS